ncbi:MAG: VanZ family protein [Erysipelothrix sp.]
MRIYLQPIKTAMLVFPFLAFAILIPFMIYQYRRYGSVSKFRSFIIYTFIFYLMSAFFLVILPLPDRSTVHTTTREMMQLQPGRFIRDFMQHTKFVWGDISTLKAGLVQGVFTQPVFNIVMVIPFGIYGRYYFNWSFKKTLCLSFLLSLFFEVTQLTGLYGYYPGPYRLFDVDDLFLNTLGGVIGFAIAPMMTFFFPKRAALDLESFEKSTHVSYIRRGVALLIDTTIIQIIASILIIALRTIQVTAIPDFVLKVLLFMIYYFVLLYAMSGQTLGMKLVKIKVISEKESLRGWQILVRTGLFYVLVYQAVPIISYLYQSFFNVDLTDGIQALIYLLIFGVYYLVMGIHFLVTIFTHDKRLFYERISRTHMDSTFHNE